MINKTPYLSKFKKIQRRLGVPLYSAIGILEGLWLSTQANAPRGDIGKLDNESIAIEIGWDGDPDELIAVLVELGWLDEHPDHRLVIHDWHDHAPGFIHASLRKRGLTFATQDQEEGQGETKEPKEPPLASPYQGGTSGSPPCQGGVRGGLGGADESEERSAESSPERSAECTAERTAEPSPERSADGTPNLTKPSLTKSNQTKPRPASSASPKRAGARRDQNYSADFEAFWQQYPKRNGKRLGKESAFGIFKRVAPTLDELLTATRHYARYCAATDTPARDAERFLAKGWWRSWLDGPGQLGANENPNAARRPTETNEWDQLVAEAERTEREVRS